MYHLTLSFSVTKYEFTKDKNQKIRNKVGKTINEVIIKFQMAKKNQVYSEELQKLHNITNNKGFIRTSVRSPLPFVKPNN